MRTVMISILCLMLSCSKMEVPAQGSESCENPISLFPADDVSVMLDTSLYGGL